MSSDWPGYAATLKLIDKAIRIAVKGATIMIDGQPYDPDKCVAL